MHQAISIMPCVHNFCGGCFSDWLKRQKDCPTCRKPIEGVSKSAAMNSMVDQFLMMNPSKKRDKEILKDIEEKNLFNAKLNYNQGEIEDIINKIKNPPPAAPARPAINVEPLVQAQKKEAAPARKAPSKKK